MVDNDFYIWRSIKRWEEKKELGKSQSAKMIMGDKWGHWETSTSLSRIAFLINPPILLFGSCQNGISCNYIWICKNIETFFFFLILYISTLFFKRHDLHINENENESYLNRTLIYALFYHLTPLIIN